MIYTDTSVLLAWLFAEDRMPPDSFFLKESLVSSRLTEYEVWTRVHARKAEATHGEAARNLLSRLAMVELTPVTLARVLEPFPTPVRTLDALHLSTIHFLHEKDRDLRVAAYDERLAVAAKKLKFNVFAP